MWFLFGEVVLLDTFLTCKISKKNINVGMSDRVSVTFYFLNILKNR